MKMESEAAKEEVQHNGDDHDDDEKHEVDVSVPPKILPMGAESVRRIVAGQAVFDLASAVKELVDNALDAGAKSVNIRLFNKGLEIVEVSDDGCGVPKSSRPYLATPHATSKINSFHDIYSSSRTSSLGFRGEALYSLANISTSLIIATRTAQDTLADKLEFRTDGSLKEDAVAQMPRKIGTTVAVLGLMQRLPVRRRDLEQRIQYHRAKLVSLISSYAIFTTGVRIHLMDMVQDAARKSFRESTVLATPPNSFSFAETVSSVLGAKFLSGMVEISFDISSIVTKDEESQKYGRQCKIHGLVSKAGIVAREQRGVKQSQQYLSINRRPVDMPKSMVRVLNECFRRCSNSDRMAPSCVLEIVLPNSEFDINLSPDKRQVLLVNEAELCEIMRTELTKFWSSQTAIGANSNSETIQRHFLCNDISGTSGEYENNNENEGDEDDEPAEAEESFSGTRMCPQRRFAFVHDPTQSVEKERLEENRRLEYKQQRRRTSLDGENQQQNLELRFEDAAAAVAAEERNLMQNKTMRSSPENDFVPQLPHEFPCAEATCINLHAFRLQNQRPILMNVTQSSPNENLITPPPRSEIHGKVALDSHLPWSERQQFRQVQAQFNSVKDNKGEMASSLEICEETCSEENGKSSGRTKSVQPKKRPSFGLERFGFRSLQEETKKRRVVNHADDPYCGKQQDLDKTAVAVRQPASVLLEDYTKNDTMRRSRPQTATRAVTSGSAETSSDSAFASAETATESTSTQTTFPTHFKTWASYDHDSSTSDIIVSAMRDRTAMRDRRRKFSTKRKYVRIDSSLPESSSLTSGVDAAEAATSDEHKETTCKKGTVSLTKTDLESLEIIGQFNLGFILARSEDGNLWILDQHACDERSNFEKLSNETIFHEQKLIAPMRMELSPLQESTIQNNIEIFEANGFRFLYDENTLPQHRFSLIAVPHSGARDGRKAVQFGKDDVIALCDMLGSNDDDEYDHNPDNSFKEAGGTGVDGTGMYKNNAVRRHARIVDSNMDRVITGLPKSVAMFASRACRNSVMVGTALSITEMGRIIKQLAVTSQPWTCAHGRPTMQHVGNFKSLVTQDEDRASAHVAGPTVTMPTQSEEVEAEH